ncbi:MAG: ATP-binding cassette domain-containing protein [Gammaproteobacteria bacterium]
MITLDNVSKAYAGQAAVDSVSLHIESNTTTALIGPSGSGKSTLLRMINGLVEPDVGTVTIRGVTLSQDNLLQQRQETGYVIQEGGLFPHLTAHDNVALMPRYLGWPEPRLQQKLDELTELVQIEADELSRYPQQLSGGQCQRISLMRALILEPTILLLDEPLGALDPIIRYELQQQLSAIFKKLGKTVVIVTHDMSEAAYFAHNIVLLREGQLVQQGSISDLIEHPGNEFVNEFIHAQRRPLQDFPTLQ